MATVPLREPVQVDDLSSERWSPQVFSEQRVEAEKLQSLFEAARSAPSMAHMQPWNFLFANKEHAEEHARIVATLAPQNARWANQAPVLIVSVAQVYQIAGKEYNSYYDLGMAVENLIMRAGQLGLAVHQIGGFDLDMLRQLLYIPEGYTPLTVIAVGYPGSDGSYPMWREREDAFQTRKPLNEFVFEGRWQKPTL